MQGTLEHRYVAPVTLRKVAGWMGPGIEPSGAQQTQFGRSKPLLGYLEVTSAPSGAHALTEELNPDPASRWQDKNQHCAPLFGTFAITLIDRGVVLVMKLLVLKIRQRRRRRRLENCSHVMQGKANRRLTHCSQLTNLSHNTAVQYK